MDYLVNIKKILLIAFAAVALTACATQKKVGKQVTAGAEAVKGDVYTGQETVEYLATGVPDRIFFATNKSVLTTAARDTLRKQAAWMRKNKDVNVTDRKSTRLNSSHT